MKGRPRWKRLRLRTRLEVAGNAAEAKAAATLQAADAIEINWRRPSEGCRSFEVDTESETYQNSISTKWYNQHD